MVIAGAGGHAREIRDILHTQGIKKISFFDNITNPLPEEMTNENVIQEEFLLRQLFEKTPEFILGTGGPTARLSLYNLFLKLGGTPMSCVSSTAIISKKAVDIGDGCNIMHRVLISNHVVISHGALINAGVQVHHDVSIGAFCEIGPSAILLGKVKIGDYVIIGAGAIVLPGILVGDGAVIGAGSVVTKDIQAGTTVKGNPAK